MSGSNPFRRDRPFAQTPTSASRQDDTVEASVRFPPLNIDPPSARGTIQTKHVQFASPLAPETPLSYSYPSSVASSPESVRHAGPPAIFVNHPTDEVSPADPFHSDDSDTSNERSDEGHNRDPQAEPAITPQTTQHGLNWRPDEPQSLSTSVVAAIEAPSADAGSIMRTPPGQAAGRGKQAIDVDAFKRLLLTGESGREGSGGVLVPPVSANHSITPGDSSSSTADSASVSHQSIFEPVTSTSMDTPRTSHELDLDDVSVERRSMYSSAAPPSRQKPSVPKTRHGRQLAEAPPSTSGTVTTLGIGDASSAATYSPPSQGPIIDVTKDTDKPLPPPSVDLSFPAPKIETPTPESGPPTRTKRPPTPPLTRRHSQIKSKTPQQAINSSATAFAAEDPSPSSPTSLPKAPSTVKAPPPPPQRKLKRASTHGTPSSESPLPISDSPRRPSATFLADLNADIDRTSQPSAELPSRTPSSASRASASLNSTSGPGIPPPLPPPRRMRGLSKSSTDSQRPASSELRRPSTESSWRVSGQSNATDILADLAALQREVDALRDNHGGGRNS